MSSLFLYNLTCAKNLTKAASYKVHQHKIKPTEKKDSLHSVEIKKCTDCKQIFHLGLKYGRNKRFAYIQL